MNTSPAILLLVLLLSACHGKEQIHHNASIYHDTTKAQQIEMTLDASCPDPTDIEPCVCTNNSDLTMDCSAIQDEYELWHVFSAYFPTTSFYELKIEFNDGLKVLENGIFHNVSFQVISMDFSTLETVESEALNPSLSTLTSLHIGVSQLATFPFERLQEFTSLTSLHLYSNNISSIPPLSSSTLHDLNLSVNPISFLPPDVFTDLPAIQLIYIHSCQLKDITPETFKDLPKLIYISLSDNSLSYIQSLTFDMVSSPSDSCFIYLDHNNIDYVEEDAFRGVPEFSKIDMNNNALTRLPETVWQPLLEKGITISLFDNPLTCGCDVAWLVNNRQLLTGVPDAQCAEGKYLTDLDPADFSVCG